MRSLQLNTPHAIVVIGIQGSGKTFFAEKFADTFSAPYIEEGMYDALAKDSDSSKLLFQRVLNETLKTNKSIIIDTSLSAKTDRTELVAKLKKLGYTTLFIWVQVDIDAAMARSRKASGISASDYKQRMQQFTQPEPSEQALVISGKHTFATQVKAILRRLTGPREPLTPPQRPTTPTRSHITIR